MGVCFFSVEAQFEGHADGLGVLELGLAVGGSTYSGQSERPCLDPLEAFALQLEGQVY